MYIQVYGRVYHGPTRTEKWRWANRGTLTKNDQMILFIIGFLVGLWDPNIYIVKALCIYIHMYVSAYVCVHLKNYYKHK